ILNAADCPANRSRSRRSAVGTERRHRAAGNRRSAKVPGTCAIAERNEVSDENLAVGERAAIGLSGPRIDRIRASAGRLVGDVLLFTAEEAAVAALQRIALVPIDTDHEVAAIADAESGECRQALLIAACGRRNAGEAL